jgi:hypothetical protein
VISMGGRSLLKAGVATAVASGFAWTTAADSSTGTTPGPLDVLEFGVPASEQVHGLTADLSSVIRGGLGQAARVLDPRDPVDGWGGTTRFTVAVARQGTTYLSLKLFGGDFADANHEWRLCPNSLPRAAAHWRSRAAP